MGCRGTVRCNVFAQQANPFSILTKINLIEMSASEGLASQNTDDLKRLRDENIALRTELAESRHYERKTGRVIVLYKEATDLPSYIEGIVWINITAGVDAAGEVIRKEVVHLVGPHA